MKKIALKIALIVVLTSCIVSAAVTASAILLPEYNFGDTGNTETVYTPGDVNGDGAINATDNSLLARILKGVTYSGVGNCDANEDGTVNATDLSFLTKKIKG